MGDTARASAPAPVSRLVGLMRWALGLVWLLPWVFLSNSADPFLLPKEAVWMTGLLLLSVHELFGRATTRARWTNPWPAWMLSLAIASMAWKWWWAFLTTAALTQIEFNFFIILPTIEVILACVAVYALATSTLTSFAACVRLSQVCCWVATSVAVVAIAEWMGFDQFFNGPGARNINFSGHEQGRYLMVAGLGGVVYTAMYLALHAPLFLMFRSWKYLAMLAVVLVALWLSGVSYCILSAGVGVAMFGWIRRYHRLPSQRRRLRLVLALVVAVSLWIAWAHRGRLIADERWPVWMFLIQRLKTSPWLGFGLGVFAVQFVSHWPDIHALLPQLANSRWHWAHNDWLQLWYEMGLLGVVLLAMTARHAVRRAWQAPTALMAGWLSSLGVMALMSLASFPWHFAATSFIGLLGWAILEAQPKEGT